MSYFKQRMAEVENIPKPDRAWSGRRLPAARLDKDIAPATDLYFIETECAERHIKIGIAADAQRRLVKLQMCCPYRLRLLAVIPGKASMEKELHQRFIADRLHGEWFRKSDALLSLIAELSAPSLLL
jgi:hypothetical protein